MEDVYRYEIRQLYLEKKKKALLCTNLLNPTTAKLKKESILHLQYGYCKSDLPALKSFFGQYKEENIDIEKCLSFSADKFRALVSYLRKEDIKTDIKNVELLAILVDYQPRPYHRFMLELEKKSSVGNPYLFEKAAGSELFFKQSIDTSYLDQFFDSDMVGTAPFSESIGISGADDKICIVYPSGARIYVDKNEIELISRLIRI